MITKLDNGRIVLICGDCLEWIPKVKQLVNLVVLDPPYYKITKEKWDNEFSEADQYLSWSKCYLAQCYQKLAPTASLYLWGQFGAKHQVLLDLAIYLREIMVFQDWLTWQKSRGRGNRKGWLITREELLWFTKSEDYFWNELAQYDLTKPTNRKDLGFNGKPRKSQFKRFSNVWECNEDQNYGADRVRGHYTPKPLVLIERIVNAHTLNPDNIVLDPFMGTGTTGVACAKLNRRFVGIEKDPQTYQMAVDRITKELKQ